jgi:hypothetical protein
MSKNRRIGNSKSYKDGYKSSRGTICQANIKIYKKQIYFGATNYVTKWVEARALRTTIAVIKAKKLYECILTKFGCPSTIISD